VRLDVPDEGRTQMHSDAISQGAEYLMKEAIRGHEEAITCNQSSTYEITCNQSSTYEITGNQSASMIRIGGRGFSDAWSSADWR
jgi:hypothetical protein